MKRKKQTLEKHIEIAKQIRAACRSLDEAFHLCQDIYGKTHPVMKAFRKIRPLEGCLSDLRCKLDKEFHDVCSEEYFKILGHIYYSYAREEEFENSVQEFREKNTKK